MLTQAKEKLGSNICLTLGDAENLPDASENFDTIVCTESYQHYPSPEKALSEVYRVLIPGGKYILCDIWSSPPLRQILNYALRFSREGDAHIYTESEIASLFTQTGFSKMQWKFLSRKAFICRGEKGVM